MQSLALVRGKKGQSIKTSEEQKIGKIVSVFFGTEYLKDLGFNIESMFLRKALIPFYRKIDGRIYVNNNICKVNIKIMKIYYPLEYQILLDNN